MLKIKSKIMSFLIFPALIFSDAMANDKFSFSTGATYITGDFGNSENTEIYFIPFTFKYKYEKFKLTIPYLKKTGPKNVVVDIGQVAQQVTTRKTTESGLGDITAAIRYNFYYNQEYKFLMDAEGKVIIGTADKRKGLGTGKTDFAFKLGLYKVFDRLTPYTRVGYKVYGSSRLNDVFVVSTGLSYKISTIISAGIDFTWREKVSNIGQEKRQITGFSNQKITNNWQLQEYIIKGFGRSTADWGGGISISYIF